MARDGSGNYNLPVNSWNPAVNGVSATPVDWQSLINDVAAALTQSVSRDGQSPMSGNLQMATNKITGLGAANGTGQALVYGQTNASLAGLALTTPASVAGQAISYGQSGASLAGLALTDVLNGAQGADIVSAATINLDTATGNVVDVTGTTTITAVTLSQGHTRIVRFTGILTLTNGASLVLPTGANITTAAGDYAVFVGYASSVVRVALYTRATGASLVSSVAVSVRQTVMSGPVDSNGLPNFGGSVGGATLTMSGTLVATAANGAGAAGNSDVIGTGTNLAWTAPAGSGTGILYATISGGVLTPVVSSLAPVYQWGGTPAVTTGQLTFNIQAMSGFLGNGATAPQTNWVAIGECAYTAGAWSGTITWYALMGRYKSATVATLPTTSVSTNFNHNLGVPQQAVTRPATFWIVNTTAEQGYSIGDVYRGWATANPFLIDPMTITGRNTMAAQSGSVGNGWDLAQRTGGAANGVTAADWSYYATIERGW